MQNPHALLLLDEDVWPGLAKALRDRGIDVKSVHELTAILSLPKIGRR